MASTYTETPDNYSEIKESVVADIDEIKSVFFKAEKVLFYDACSFQRHSNLRENEKSILIRYFENRGIAIFDKMYTDGTIRRQPRLESAVY